MKFLYLVMGVPFFVSGAFKLGIEAIPETVRSSLIASKSRIALVTNHTGVDQAGKRSIDILRGCGLQLAAIFTPEHGITGTIEAAADVHNSHDSITGVPIISLYKNGSGKKIDANLLKNIDTIFFDIQDSGMRHYTYISTLFMVLQAAALCNKKVVVCDRPNPLGIGMEGPLVEPDLLSFVSIAPIPLRHGMTVGELSQYFNTHILNGKVDLIVVPMCGYQRNQKLPLLVGLSPNIATQAACHGYSFLGLLGEIRPFDVGVGTPQSFQCILLPESLSISSLIWQELAAELKMLGIDSVPQRISHSRKKEWYHGLTICIPNINRVAAFKAFLKTIHVIKKSGITLTYNSIFDKAIGTVQIRKFLNDHITDDALKTEINNGLQSFFKRARPLFMYNPHPELYLW